MVSVAREQQHTSPPGAGKSSTRRTANVSLDNDLVREARELGLNVSRACNNGLTLAVRTERERRWREENRDAIEERVRYVEANGLPLASLRMFEVE